MFAQFRGPTYWQEILDEGLETERLAPAFKLCTDTLSLSLATEAWTHKNKCGPVDVEDARGTKSNSASISLSFAEQKDSIFAFATLGIVRAAGSPNTVTDEELPGDLADGDVWFLGGKTRHRAITDLVISGMTVTTDYTLDAASGMVTFIGDQSASPPPTASYGHTDPQYVSLLQAPVKRYFVSQEFINKQAANDPGSLELYKVQVDPTDNMDMQSEEALISSLKGSCLADLNRDPDELLGQFGRRVL